MDDSWNETLFGARIHQEFCPKPLVSATENAHEPRPDYQTHQTGGSRLGAAATFTVSAGFTGMICHLTASLRAASKTA